MGAFLSPASPAARSKAGRVFWARAHRLTIRAPVQLFLARVHLSRALLRSSRGVTNPCVSFLRLSTPGVCRTCCSRDWPGFCEGGKLVVPLYKGMDRLVGVGSFASRLASSIARRVYSLSTGQVLPTEKEDSASRPRQSSSSRSVLELGCLLRPPRPFPRQIDGPHARSPLVVSGPEQQSIQVQLQEKKYRCCSVSCVLLESPLPSSCRVWRAGAWPYVQLAGARVHDWQFSPERKTVHSVASVPSRPQARSRAVALTWCCSCVPVNQSGSCKTRLGGGISRFSLQPPPPAPFQSRWSSRFRFCLAM